MDYTRTYAELRGEQPFDWNEFLHRENHTEAELSEATQLAQDWVTCACGNQCAAIPRYTEAPCRGMPVDQELTILGANFADAVGRLWVEDVFFDTWRGKAISVLERIEERSAEIIQEITGTKA